MFSKKHRLTTTQFNAVFKNGVVLRTKHLMVRIDVDAVPLSCAVVVSKKVARTAVARNSLRRKVFACVRKCVKEKNITHGAYIFSVSSATLPPHDVLCEEVHTIFKKNQK